ncbi:hypothetical protein C4K88_03920 [Arthrobacter pityocampae]|uniref:Uncharacterized protein n=1 Tax=Arthrobacter pityocampae TaxID=547334 RepID=A0A2S5J0H8_9MICC|nr:hypothetical protein C4K88_03920 [Arthrobacter pityocampae]
MVGAVAGVLGLAPWLITGARLPLQNLWATLEGPDRMPLALLPLSQYSLVTIVVLLVVGGAAAGITLRIWNPTRHRTTVKYAAAALCAVQLAAVTQSFTVLHAGLMGGTAATIYVLGLLLGTILSLAASITLLLLLASRSRTTVALAIGILAVPLATWAVEWFIGLAGPMDLPSWLPIISRWLPAITIGCTLAWFGLRSVRDAGVWITNLALLWLVPALFTTINVVFGTRVSLGNPGEMLRLGQQILATTLGADGGAAPVVLLALIIAILGTGTRLIAARITTPTTGRPPAST